MTSNHVAFTSPSYVAAPISKVYKRCQWGTHAKCPGSFQNASVCSCTCHVAKSAPRKARKAKAIAPTPIAQTRKPRVVAPAKPVAPVKVAAEVSRVDVNELAQRLATMLADMLR